MMKISDKQKMYNLERKLEKCEQMISVLQRSTCTATAAMPGPETGFQQASISAETSGFDSAQATDIVQ